MTGGVELGRRYPVSQVNNAIAVINAIFNHSHSARRKREGSRA